MAGWDALLNAMRTSRASRIGPDHAEQLLAGGSGAPEHAGLARLLSAAAAPAQPHELASEQAMVAEFVRVRREPAPRVHPPRARGARLFLSGRARGAPLFPVGRLAVAKAATGLALLMAGGTAFAAETGYLPGPAQRRAHNLFSSLGVPPPSAAPVRDGVSRHPPQVATSSHPATPAPSSSAMAELCKTWVEAHRGPHAPEMRAEDLRALAAAAGGREAIRGFCAHLLGEDRTRPSAPAINPPTSPNVPNVPSQPSHPGNGGGNGKGPGRR